DLWLGHRLYGVDGSKINLPAPLLKEGYSKPQPNSHYPQGLLSSCYQLKAKIPHDFDLVSHGNERLCALAHLKTLRPNDVCVYDRGYFSYALLSLHIDADVFPIFRLKKNSGKVIDEFMESNEVDKIVTIVPTKARQREIIKDFPCMKFTPKRLRLIKYTIGENSYTIGTTLVGAPYTIAALKEVYHSRWGIEELYKISKKLIEVDDFHGKSERGVKQELFSHFVLITMSRYCAGASESLLKSLLNLSDDNEEIVDDNIEGEGEIKIKPRIQVNFKNILATVARQLEEILYAPSTRINHIMANLVRSVARYYYKSRDGRHYTRESKQPAKQWNQRASSA
ncbi:MAG: IS4 family transposase, partial [Sedimenticola sp.]